MDFNAWVQHDRLEERLPSYKLACRVCCGCIRYTHARTTRAAYKMQQRGIDKQESPGGRSAGSPLLKLSAPEAVEPWRGVHA